MAINQPVFFWIIAFLFIKLTLIMLGFKNAFINTEKAFAFEFFPIERQGPIYPV